jgi:hypothetical protein
MKFKLPLSLLLIAITIGACKRLDQLVSFNLDTKDQVVWEKAPDSLLTDTILNNELVFFVSEDFSFNDNEKFEQNNATSTTVEDVEALSLTIQIDSGATNFSFMKDMSLYISSPSNLYKDTKLIGLADPDPVEDFITLELLPTNEEFLNFIQRDKYRFRTEFTLVSPMPDTVYLSYKMGFRLKATPQE